jgi:hypothetical protein
MALNDIEPQGGVSHFGGGAVPLKRRVAAIKAGQNATINLTLLDNDGNAVDLTSYDVVASSGSILAKFKDSVTITAAAAVSSAACAVETAASGEISCVVPDAVKRQPGIYIGEFGVLDDSDNMTFSNTLYVIVDQGLFGALDDSVGPPSMAEIRLFLRDYVQENELLDTVDFDGAEIAAAITMPVRFWNESLPPLPKTYNSQTFPWRYHWLMAICAHLYSIAGEHYRRNDLSYNAGGMAIADKNKHGLYEQKAAQMMDEWRMFVKTKKVSLNLDRGYSSFGSTYGNG